ncbi:MAG TPA: prepilin-type N-terminal cleavage/methylation domain-containing protein [Verrucomicrobiales bacterium]|nr:prepilin-type N-terminal cleavage/methylation domain-containing protein [Verrucomicrobiales bacterium]
MKKLAVNSLSNRNRKSKSGFTLVEIMLVVLIIGLLAALAIPSFMKARKKAQRVTCIENLRVIAGINDQWAIESNANSGTASPTWAQAGSYFKSVPVCPTGGNYTPNAIGVDPDCSVNGHTL